MKRLVNVSDYKSVGYDPIRDFAPITLAVVAPQLVVVHPSVPAKTFKEFTEVDAVFSDMAVVLPHVKAGKLRALAVTGPKPTPLVPRVPSIAEVGVPGYAMTSWWGVFGPAGTPEPIITRLNTELRRILQLQDGKDLFATLGVDAATSSPA